MPPNRLGFVQVSVVLRALVVMLTLVALVPAIAIAHGALKRSSPASGAHLSVAPRELRLTFTEAPELAFTRIRLLDPDSADVALGPLSIDSILTAVASVRGALAAGTYTVVWQVAGADGHPVRGRFRFTIAPGATGLMVAAAPVPAVVQTDGEVAGNVSAPGQSAAPAAHHDAASMPDGDGFGAESLPYVVLRWLQFMALLTVIGALAFRLVVLRLLDRREPPESAARSLLPTLSERTATFALGAAAVLGGIALLRLYAQSYAMHGESDALNGGLIASMVSTTVWGWGWILQVIGVALAITGFVVARRGSGTGWAIATVGAIALSYSPALSGHAASSPRLTGLVILTDGLHIIGAGGWLGSLLFVIGLGLPAALVLAERDRGAVVASLVNAFSPTAIIFAALAAATGIFAAWLHLESVAALWQTPYGRMLMRKLAVLSIVIGTGAYNYLRVRPALGDIAGARRIRRSATVELVMGAVVLALTAALVATPTSIDSP